MENKIVFLVKEQQIIVHAQQLVQTINFDEHELQKGRILQPITVSYRLKALLEQYQFKKIAAFVIFSDELTTRQIVSNREHATDLSTQMYVKIALNSQWHYLAILPTGLLLQYQLLFWQMGLYIQYFSTEFVNYVRYSNLEQKAQFRLIDSLAKLDVLVKSGYVNLYQQMMAGN